jgi:threonine dehydrogenase-like Zn-dependent dehydrogenase
MRALSYRGPSRVRIEDKPLPKILHPQDAILRVTRTAICGSDLHLYHGLVPDTRVGCTFGHEFTGVVEEVGSEVKTLHAGDRVVVPFNIACGTCFACRRGLTANCENANPNSDLAGGMYGSSHTAGGYEGGQAEYVRVPYAHVGPMKIPDELHDEQVLFLSDVLPTGYQAAEMGAIAPGDTVVVFGAGPVGIFAARSAWLLGAGRVIVVDGVDYRLEFVRSHARVEALDHRALGRDLVPQLKALTDGRGPDVAIDCVGCEANGSRWHEWLGAAVLEHGRPTALAWSIEAVRPGGHVSVVGVYGPPWNLLPLGTAMNKGLTLRMSQCHVARHMPHLLDLVTARLLEPEKIITHRLSLEEAPTAYRLFADKLDDCIKCVLIPGNA